MYSPINYIKNNFLLDYDTNSDKTHKNKSSKGKSNSLNQKKLILSRNDNILNKNLILKTKTNNNNNISFKKIISANNQFSFENISLTNQKKKDDTFNQKSLYKYISSKIKENNQKNLNHRNINNNNNSKLYSTKLDFSMNQIKSINKQKKEEKNKFNKYKGINKANKTSKNYYKKILNFPASPGNKKVKLLKINDLDIHEVASSFNYINKERDDNNHKRILSSQNFFKNKISNISENNNNTDNKISSFIYQNTNNINLNVNIINKGIILNSFGNSNENNNNYNSLLSFKKTKTITHRNANKYKKEIFNISSFRNSSINKENDFFPEEIHFKAVKYMQEIKNFDESKT